MINIKKMDSELYASVYGLPRCGDYDSIWNKIKNSNWMLKEAIKPCKDKFGEKDTVSGLAICDSILMDFNSVNQDIYQELVNLIYSNTDIARIVLGGRENLGNSYLLMTLWNKGLILTDEQKAFAVNEAINQVHGVFPFDIGYQILVNDNWSIEEKAKLVYDFYADADIYDDALEHWEWDIINDPANYKGYCISQLNKCDLYHYTYEQLLKFYSSKEIADRIWGEIEFCKLMHTLRPQQWETKYGLVKRIGEI